MVNLNTLHNNAELSESLTDYIYGQKPIRRYKRNHNNIKDLLNKNQVSTFNSYRLRSRCLNMKNVAGASVIPLLQYNRILECFHFVSRYDKYQFKYMKRGRHGNTIR